MSPVEPHEPRGIPDEHIALAEKFMSDVRALRGQSVTPGRVLDLLETVVQQLHQILSTLREGVHDTSERPKPVKLTK